MFAARFACSWIGAFGLVAGAYCQTYVPINLGFGGGGVADCSNRCAPYVEPLIINNAGTIASGLTPGIP